MNLVIEKVLTGGDHKKLQQVPSTAIGKFQNGTRCHAWALVDTLTKTYALRRTFLSNTPSRLFQNLHLVRINGSIHWRITRNCNKCHATPLAISRWQKMARIGIGNFKNGITFTQSYAAGCSASYFFAFSIAVFASTYTTAASVTVMTMRNVGVLKAFFWKTPH